ncbi:glycosyltransferase [Candidatus Woesebacteria bacterium]|nr:glycosyltransferase [Candidatus Woesebacteria bacterium]
MANKSTKTLKPTISLSVVIPACNESSNLPVLLKSIAANLSLSSISYEIIVVDDGSSDATQKILKPYLHSDRFSLITNPATIGKSLSVLSGYAIAKGEYIALLDADLSECSKALPDLFNLAKSGYSITQPAGPWYLRALGTTTQRGPKVFPRFIFEHISATNLNNWNIESELIHTANNLDLKQQTIECDLPHKSRPKSWRTRLTRSLHTISTKLRHLSTSPVYVQSPASIDHMVGAGVTFRRKSFVTHSTLPHHLSALKTFAPWQVAIILTLVGSFGWGLVVNTIPTLIILTSLLSFIYLLDVIFNMFVTLKSLHFPPELTFSIEQIGNLKDSELPVYSILVPLYKEAGVLPHFITSMEKLDYPTKKLDILLLLEEGDDDTILTAQKLNLPLQYRIIIVPKSSPKTKPKACNYGLAFVRGDYAVIYDAEDRPDPLQLKKAYLALRDDHTIGCVQAKLNYFNPGDNLLTRFFTAEYSLWFDVILPGLQSINTSIPLGGTSNHFRTSVLRQLHGWDAFNVTEDADLGTRLFNAGYHTAIIDSTTLEEANSNWRNWVRQRSRWLKGYMQTYLVHMRDPIKLFRAQGVHALLFNLIVGGKISFILINPFLWIMTISYFALYAHLGPFIESIYPASIFYIAVTSLLFGNFIALYNYMIGCSKRGHWELIKYVYLIPLYWLAISYAAAMALWQLIVNPHYWEKTIHGLDLLKTTKSVQKDLQKSELPRQRGIRLAKLVETMTSSFSAGGVMVISSVISNFLNFLYASYLGRNLGIADFGAITLFGSLLMITQVPIGALGSALTHRSAYLLGKYGAPVKELWSKLRLSSFKLAVIATAIYIALIPLLKNFFVFDSYTPFLLFIPVWVIGTLASVDGGFLGGALMFNSLAILTALEATTKLLLTIVFVSLGLGEYVYVVIPLSMSSSFILGYFFVRAIKTKKVAVDLTSELSFPRRFYTSSIIIALTSLAYTTMDVVLAKHYLSPVDAGIYSYLSLAGKMVFLTSSMFSGFIIPYVSRAVGEGKQGRRFFNKLLILVTGASLSAFIVFGVFGSYTAPILWGDKAQGIIPFLIPYGLSMVAYSISSLYVKYHLARGENMFAYAGFLVAIAQTIAIILNHNGVGEIAESVIIASFFSLALMIGLDRFYSQALIVQRAFLDLTGLFKKLPETAPLSNNKLRILIFNWRDLRHSWAGGAEVYIHELSKRWVEGGNEVTVFCGNDGGSPRHAKVDGVQIIRRGGFFMVYFWAFAYYHFRLRGRYDIILDSENGLPFFTPLYVSEPVFLLIHHVHQEVFRKSLIPPFSWLAQFLEKRVMPLAYRKTEVITVSPSSKAEIIDHKLTKRVPHIIYNGVDLGTYIPGKKSPNPTILYLGRLTTAKSVHILIHTMTSLIKELPNLECIVAGDGPTRPQLEKLVIKLKLKDHVKFLGKVSEEDKVKLYQSSWVFVNPSLIEGWGITTIEANACGTPVVASNVPGLRDAVSDTISGILVPYGQVGGFTLAISAMLKDAKLRNNLSRGAVSWAKKFDWSTSAKSSIKLLSRIYAK